MTINTSNGTYIVPQDKEASLIQWLELNAIKAGQGPTIVREHSSETSSATYLINEQFSRVL